MIWTADNRASLMQRLAEIAEAFERKGVVGLGVETTRALQQEEEDLLLEYAEILPRQTVSRCPICGEELRVAIDLAGFDGPWWWTTCPVDLPQHHACEHFQVFLGAVNLRGREPEEVTEPVLAGPGAPFVVDRLMKMDGVKAVLSRLVTEAGDHVYLISYFSEQPIDDTELHQEFRLESYALLDDEGQPEFAEYKFDPWNFELAPWFESGSLLWIAPGDEDFVVRSGAGNPYEGLEGTPMKQVLEYGECLLEEPPMGQESTLFEQP